MAHRCPRLRPVDAVFVDVPGVGQRLVLRDTEGVSEDEIALDPALAHVLALLDGSRTHDDVAAEARVAVGAVRDTVRLLDEAYLLAGARFERRRRAVVDAFSDAPVRAAFHAGGAYHRDPARLSRFIDRECLASAPATSSRGRIVALCAPHMDLWRAARGYGHAYQALLDGISEEARTVVLLGTSHAPMARPFAMCAKAFETPLGELAPDLSAMDRLAGAARFDPFADAYLHRVEHSIEFQAVLLRHVLARRGHREVKVVPILCGLGDAQSMRRQPEALPDAESFLGALAELVAELGPRALVIAGADLAHVGPRFGDRSALDAMGRAALDERDRRSLELAAAGEPSRFFEDVTKDLASRRVCGVGPMYTLLRAVGPRRGEVLHYTQHVDPGDGSIVSHASLAYRA